MKNSNENKAWHTSKVNEFWGRIASRENVFHVYENEDKFMDLLAGFVGTGINSGDCNIVIATSRHLDELRKYLESSGVHFNTLIEDERYVPIDAEKLLQQFMVNDLPSEKLFINCLSTLFKNSQQRGRKVRLYREMVCVLDANGNDTGRRQLEAFWNKFNQIEQIPIFCAYPFRSAEEEECSSLSKIGFVSPRIVRNSQSPAYIMHALCEQ